MGGGVVFVAGDLLTSFKTTWSYFLAPSQEGKVPFKGLHIRERRQIVADALDGPLDWQRAGTDLPPMEWHERLAKAEGGGEDGPIILDCRNEYETGVGRFVGAEPLNTDTFRDTWGKLRERLEGVPKDREIMTYCTGGIRCVKVGAYLEQEMGFKNVSRLAGGIIAYDRAVQEERERGKEGMESLFHGTNFVFDGRLGRKITDHKVREASGSFLRRASIWVKFSKCASKRVLIINSLFAARCLPHLRYQDEPCHQLLEHRVPQEDGPVRGVREGS